MNDFFDWIYSGLQPFVSKSVVETEVDMKKLFIYGNSAGKRLPTTLYRITLAIYP
jgi:hypothetical protein